LAMDANAYFLGSHYTETWPEATGKSGSYPSVY